MNKIQMVDLKGQYDKIKSEIDSGIQDVINNTAFINGSKVEEFAAELKSYLNVKHVIPCGNGTDALQIALMSLDLPKGSKVICPAFNYVATAETVAFLGLTPVYVDVLEDTFELDIDKAREIIDEDVKVVMPVHLFGQSVNMDAVMDLANEFKLYVIEDAAQAIGADYFGKKYSGKVGTIGQIGTTSFFPSKNLGCYGDGGAIFTNDNDLAIKLKQIANHGQSKKYHFDCIGVNSRLDTIQAAILKVKLPFLDDYSNARSEVADRYDDAFVSIDEIKIPVRNSASTHVFHQYTLQIENGKRDDLKEFLELKNIPSMIYYPKPLHLHKAYEYLGYKKGDFTVSERLCEKVLSLPIHTEMKKEQQDYIIESVLQFFKK